jgi:hypothetical protein
MRSSGPDRLFLAEMQFGAFHTLRPRKQLSEISAVTTFRRVPNADSVHAFAPSFALCRSFVCLDSSKHSVALLSRAWSSKH